MKAGVASADITPGPGITLSGFIARQNQPATEFRDPLGVRCLALQDRGGPVHLLFSYDLLGIGRELLGQIQADLGAALGTNYANERAVFAATHTHSAPATVLLEGCGIPVPAYWDQVRAASIAAARAAVAGLREAELSVARRRITGVSYNRRQVLANGRVTMARSPADEIVAVGPVDDELTVLAWHDHAGRPLATGLHFAMHPAINGSQIGTADYPGELGRQVERRLGAPCFFLQGCSGDINPLWIATGYAEAIQAGQAVAAQLDGIGAELRPLPAARLRSAVRTVPLAYDRGLDTARLRRELDQLAAVAAWQPGTIPSAAALRALADILNVEPGTTPDLAMHAFNARTLVAAGERTLAALDSGRALPDCPLALAVWDLGGVVLLFAAAELFAETGQRLRALAADRVCLPVGYTAPLVGYLPTRAALGQGGYEVDYAWRYYGHPAAFAADAEERTRQALRELIEETAR